MMWKRNLLILIPVVIVFILCVSCIWIFLPEPNPCKPALSIERPQKMSATAIEPFSLDVVLSDLGDTYYPAMSASIRFDSSHLEFLGIEEGNVFVRDDGNATGQKLPEWSCNVEQCNAGGVIRVMYLDMTGGKHSFERSFLSGKNRVLFRLKFRLRGSVNSGEVYDLFFEDAVFAAFDESQSLASNTGALQIKNSKIVIGE